tara:strand:+ start:2176 stop:3405 length:1230 start_codon:yes stop_codon:yes gene_type:complete
MKIILLILKKDLKLFFSNKKAVLLTFLIPIILISLFAFAFGGIGQKSTSFNPIELLYTDNDQSDFSKKIVNKLNDVKELKLVNLNEGESENLLKKGKNVGFLKIYSGFQDSLKLGKELPVILKYDASKQFEFGILKSIVTGKIMSAVGNEIQKIKTKEYLDKSFNNLTDLQKEKITREVLNSEATNSSTTISLKTESILKEQDKKGILGLIQAVAGTAIMMLLFSISGVGGGLLEEKESGTLSRLFYAPLKLTSIIFGKMGAAFVISFLQLTIMFVFAWLAFGLPIFNDLFSLIILTIAVAFAVSSFGLFLVSIAKTRQQLQGLSTIIILVMSAIGGSMIPLFIMPSIMQKIAVISLNYWGIQGYFDIFWRQLPFIEILPKIAVLCAIGLIMTVISIPLFKKNIAALTN